MEAKDLILQLSNIVSPLIGHTIGVDHIHTDENGWYYYIPAKSLQKKNPLVLNHYRGSLFMVIPINDWYELEKNSISVQEYVDTSVWSFGYFWGGGSMLSGVHWQPFEEKGIQETEKISRYLRILSCRTHLVSSGHMITKEDCNACLIKNCPFSPFKTNVFWENEVREVDDRIQFCKAVKERLEKNFNLKAISFLNQEKDSIWIFPCWDRDTVQVCLPKKLLIDMMYNPGKYSPETIANDLPIELGVSCHYEGEDFVPAKRIIVPDEADIQFFYEYWRKDVGAKHWFETATATVDTSTADEAHDLSFLEKVSKFFKSLF